MQTKKLPTGVCFSFSFSVRHQASFCSLQITASSSLNENSHEKMKQRQECRDTRGHKTKQIVPPSHISSCSGLLRSLFFSSGWRANQKNGADGRVGISMGFRLQKRQKKKENGERHVNKRQVNSTETRENSREKERERETKCLPFQLTFHQTSTLLHPGKGKRGETRTNIRTYRNFLLRNRLPPPLFFPN